MVTPSLRQLDLFAHMIAAGSLFRCADELGLSVEDVERDIASLEMRLGYSLFDDLHGRAQLTIAGRKTAEAMTLLSLSSEEQKAAVAEKKADTIFRPGPPVAARGEPRFVPTVARPISGRQPVTLAIPAPVFGHFQDALAAFEEANEDVAISLDLNVLLADDADRLLGADQADIAYFYALGEGDFPSRYGWSEQINLYADAGHLLGGAASVSRADVAHVPMLKLERGNGVRQIIDLAFRRGGVATGDVALESGDMYEVITALHERRGCFAAFGPLARDLGRMSNIKRLALDAPLPVIEVRQAINPRSAGLPMVEALAEYLFR